MADAKSIVKKLKEAETKYVDFRFTDPRGKWQHVAFDIGMCDEDALKEGIMFDGSSIAGWKAINESDMLLMPDLDSLTFDPFAAQTTAVLFCDVLNPGEGTPTTAARAASPRRPRTSSSRPRLPTLPSSVPKPNSSCSTMSVTRPR